MSALLALDPAYWQVTTLKGLLALVVVPTGAAIIVFVLLFKFVSFMHNRLGPMEAGPHGSLQLVAEAVRFMQKEDLSPDGADKRVFRMAPILVMVSTFLIFVVIPAGPNAILSDLPGGIYYVLAVSGVSVLGILMAGWASANKYALIGGLRAAGQLIAYELPMVLSVLGVVIAAGTMNLQGIVYAQSRGAIFGWDGIGNPFVLTQFVGLLIFLITVQAELTQTPFDMPVAESELVAGYQVEYTGVRFLLFFLAEFSTAFGFSAIAATIFLGGWALPESWGVDHTIMHFVGPGVLLAKTMIFCTLIFWVRFSFPRLREDQLQRFAWKVLVPVSLLNIVATAILKVAF
jgi:NADH-quinone oxidoreductase subunit H